MHQRTVSVLGGKRSGYGQGGGGESEGGVTRRSRSSGAEGRGTVSRGHVNAITSRGLEQNNDNEGGYEI